MGIMITSKLNQPRRGFLASGTMLAAVSSATASDRDSFLADVQSGDPAKQLAAWKRADRQESAVIVPLGKLLISETMSIQKAARQCIEKIVHSVGKKKDNPSRGVVTNYLLMLLTEEPQPIRAFALRMLSLLADGDSVPYIAPLLLVKELREEAVFCLERISCEPAVDALIGALDRVDPDFLPRLIASLGYIQAEKSVPSIENYMQSENLDLALAAAKAIARIGIMPETDPPNFEKLSYRQKKILMDSVLRFCDGQIQRGKYDFPIDFLTDFLDNDDEEIEEHFICGAIVSASNIDRPEIVAAIIRQLNRPLYIVRDTAVKTLIAMKGQSVDKALQEAAAKAEDDVKKTLEDILSRRKV